jgi:hypothetical protein
MTHSLAPGISFAETSGRLVFLDAIADRYTMLAPEAEAALRAMMEAEQPVAPTDGWAARLRALGLIVGNASGTRIAPCKAQRAERSALDRPLPGAGVRAVSMAYVGYATSRAALRRGGLARELARLERSRSSGTGPRVSPNAVSRETAAFAALRRWATPLDQCLPLSLALARRCATHDARVKLVLGVKLRPFRAHAWVQCEGVILNDHVDAVRPFAPVLVV